MNVQRAEGPTSHPNLYRLFDVTPCCWSGGGGDSCPVVTKVEQHFSSECFDCSHRVCQWGVSESRGISDHASCHGELYAKNRDMPDAPLPLRKLDVLAGRQMGALLTTRATDLRLGRGCHMSSCDPLWVKGKMGPRDACVGNHSCRRPLRNPAITRCMVGTLSGVSPLGATWHPTT
jgi:hypothetical protein